MVKYFFNAENLRKLAKKVQYGILAIAAAGVLLTIIIHLLEGGDFDNLFDYASTYLIICVVVAAFAKPSNILFNWLAKKVEKTQESYIAMASVAFEKMLAENSVDEIADKETYAKVYAKAVQSILLKAPGTAKFCDFNEMTVVSSNDTYTVSGYVDSQNSYGAYVRTPFTYNIKEENGKWIFTDAIITPQAVFAINFAIIMTACVLFGILFTVVLNMLFGALI